MKSLLFVLILIFAINAKASGYCHVQEIDPVSYNS